MENIVPVHLSEQFREDYQKYGIYVLFRRIMTDVRDGLKIVQRRIIYDMVDINATAKQTKSANVVGSTMRFHPHGDTSIYDTMKPMSNWFESYIPLLKPQGNWGTPYGDPQAASRYTETRLSDFALDCVVADLNEARESVDWDDNYDNSLKEPAYLPVAVPLLLINGSFGIGLGKKIDIPCHNINEVIDATLALMQNPNQQITLIPDTCMNCDIFDDANWEEISNTGVGFFTVRGHIEIDTDYCSDEYKHRTALYVTSLPDKVYMEQVKNQIEQLVLKKKLVQIDGLNDDSNESHPLRFAIILKQGADPEYVKTMLWQNTSIQQNQRINFEMLQGLNTIRPSYREYLLMFIENRKMVKYRVFVNRLRMIETKLHEKEALIKLLESGKIKEVTEKILSYRKDDSELIEYLIKLLDITDLQAKYIIDYPLKGLSIYALEKLKKSREQLTTMRDQYMTLLTNEHAITQYIADELIQIKQKYGCPRRSRIIHKPSAKDAIPKGMMTIIITEKGFIKKIPLGTDVGNIRNDTAKLATDIDNADNLIIFDSSGRLWKLPIHKVPFSDKNSNGVDLRFIFKNFNGSAVAAIPELGFIKKYRSRSKTKDRLFVISITKQGYVKKMELDEFLNVTSAGLIYAKMDTGDYVQKVIMAYSGSIIMVFDDRKVMNISVDQVATMKRAARGRATLKSKSIDGITRLEAQAQHLLVITAEGRVNKIPMNCIPGMDTTMKEFSIIRLNKNDVIQNVLVANDTDTLVMRAVSLGTTGEQAIPVRDIEQGSSVHGGIKVVKLKANDRIVQSYIMPQQV